MACKNHSDVNALYECRTCNNVFCAECVEDRRIGDFTAYICRECGGKCEHVDARKAVRAGMKGIKEVTSASFWSELPSAFTYPLRQSGKWVLFVGAILFGILSRFSSMSMSPFGLPLLIIVTSYLCMYLFQVVVTTAYGDDDPPGWPSIAQWIDMVFGPFILIALALTLCGGPAAAYAWHTRSFDVLFWSMLGGGIVLFPMFLLMIAITEKFSAINPLLIIISIFKAPLHYLITALLFVWLFWLRSASRGFLGGVPFAGFVLQEIVMFYFLIAQMRVLGIFYRANEAKLVGSDDEEEVEHVQL
ncbi:hypothetical protein ACFL38_04675 [Candidatus Omnitrophota bacterium]